jgi:hypothetical protein
MRGGVVSDNESKAIELWSTTDGMDLAREVVQLREVLDDVVSAWTVPGPHPQYHETAKARLRWDWSTLANAVERAAKARGR